MINGTNIGNLAFAGSNPQTQALTFRGRLLKANNINQIQLLIPGATTPEGDSRRLGLALVSLKIYPLE
jgi:hypothetical protein